MRIDIYKDFTLIDVVTSYVSLSVSEEFRGSGTFTLVLNNSEVYKELEVKNNVFVIGNNAYILENKHKTDTKEYKTYELTGRQINSILNRRVVTSFTIASGEYYETAAIRLITENFINPTDSNRKIHNLTVKNNGIAQVSGTIRTIKAATCQSVLNQILSSAELGYKLNYDIKNKCFVFEVLEHTDRSNSVIFGDRFNNIADTDIYEETQDYLNVGYLFDEETSTVITYGDTSISGIERRETIETGSDSEVITSALDEAIEVLGAEFNIKQSNQYEYNKDYFLGDKVRLIDNDSNLQACRNILGVTHYYENTYEMEISFGDSIPTIFDRLNRR